MPILGYWNATATAVLRMEVNGTFQLSSYNRVSKADVLHNAFDELISALTV